MLPLLEVTKAWSHWAVLLTSSYNRGKRQMIKSYVPCMVARGQIFLLEVQNGLTLIQFLPS